MVLSCPTILATPVGLVKYPLSPSFENSLVCKSGKKELAVAFAEIMMGSLVLNLTRIPVRTREYEKGSEGEENDHAF